jgi:hypothetical protein
MIVTARELPSSCACASATVAKTAAATQHPLRARFMLLTAVRAP